MDLDSRLGLSHNPCMSPFIPHSAPVVPVGRWGGEDGADRTSHLPGGLTLDGHLAPRTHLRRGTFRLVILAASLMMGLASCTEADQSHEPNAASTPAKFEGTGVEILLPPGWVAADDPSVLPQPEEPFIRPLLREPQKPRKGVETRLVGYGGVRGLWIKTLRFPTEPSLARAEELYTADFSNLGYEIRSRKPSLVDGNRATRIVSTSTAEDESDVEFLWVEGSLLWIVSWFTTVDDLNDALQTFDSATQTLRLLDTTG
jgi:hypothetical protein